MSKKKIIIAVLVAIVAIALGCISCTLQKHRSIP